MGGESSFSAVAPPIFDGDNYQMWAVRMETYLEALDLWEVIEEDYEVPPLPANPTVAQIKLQKEKKTRKSKAKACLFAAVSQMIFMRIMSLKTAKKIWDYLKAEYEGDERIRGMKALNLIRDFELQKMKESESVKEYSDRLLSIANNVRLLGSVLNDSRIVEKLLVTLPEKFEATITTLENTKDLSKISLTELLNALQAQEQRRSMRQEGVIEGALLVKHQDSRRYKNNKNFKNQLTYGDSSANYQKTKGGGFKKSYPPCRHCEKKGHPPYKCWRRPDAFCSKCNQLGHEAMNKGMLSVTIVFL
ncbi:uncharacterized protein LOC111434088 [Cucurbita moschata]|uniref:Uncharacterized protein LOC111434088 n=1 Tax=Cucurbita moschata TaxID=3662 RepID=A0A6J1EGX0_CUCMO|nr:uncharacterized protein LOC111434088 [Cucurbita moschata]